VTEAVTGVDLVEWQLRVAAGEALPKSQDQLELNGHSFEVRLYAEDVPKGFLPATGTLTHLQFAKGCRADTGVRSGDVISPFYDPMIAKIVVHGATREIALSQLRAAISGTQVAGTVTNLTFLGKLARDAEFSVGDVDTGLIGRNIEALSAPEPAPAQVRALAILAAADLGSGDDGFALWSPMERTIDLIEDEAFSAKLQVLDPESVVVEMDGNALTVPRRGLAGTQALKIGDTVSVFGAETWHFDIPDPLAVGVEVGGGNLIEAPMPGLVKGVFAQAGQVVTAGDRLAILEAMKMEHTMAAPRDGVVAEVLVSEGTQVEAGAPLVRLEDEE